VKVTSRLSWHVVARWFGLRAIMLAFTMADILSRVWLGTPGG
jgi:hypothetical protein